ncbi:MAG: formylglycine-generating enzyme family protein [Bacteroidaceae bacterium]|nr:formylglycine-generating enzyme family protein [Bacteroidaceae bacterium]
MKEKLLIILLICVFFVSCSNKRKLNLNQSEFVYIEPGVYTIGSPVGEYGRWPKGEEDIRKVKTSGFLISKTEITEEQYYSVVDSDYASDSYSNLPVVNISWLDAIRYCNIRSSNEGLLEVYNIPKKDDVTLKDITINKNASGYRLPNIDEWEISCRAKTRTPYYTGKKILHTEANYNSDGRMSVASFPPNKFGLYDMSGNVDEWCFRNDFFALYKGGSWKSSKMTFLRSSSIGFSDEYEKNDHTGFRIIKNDMSLLH